MSDRKRRPLLVFALTATLFVLNAAIAWRLFHTEYLVWTGSGEGATISYARYARDHWPDLGWCRFWYAGLPFQNAYVPGLHLTVAAYSAIRHISAAAAFHQVVAFLYSMGPVTLFWLALRLTNAAGWSFCAGLLYSLISPSAFLVPEIRHDLGSLWWAQRLHSMVFYSDNPHVAALTLVPLAILLLDIAIENRKPVWYIAAAFAMAAVPLTNWPGAIGLAMAAVAYALSVGSGWRKWAATAGIAGLGYGFVVTWIPPSTIVKTQADTQTFDPVNRFGAHHLVYAVMIVGCSLFLLRLFSAARLPRHIRFFLLFLFFAAAPTLAHYWLGATLLAQPHRFHLEMEMAIALSLVFGIRMLIGQKPAVVRALALVFAAFCVFQFVQYRMYARHLIRSVDITKTSEYKTARWFDQHMRDNRVMVPGSTSFWFNAFTDTPQLTGCCPQGVLNQIILIANYGINTDLTAENRGFENSLLWFYALGVRAVAVSGPHSTEVYKPFYHPEKFAGRLPVLWRDGDDIIYEVPWRYYSLAHAMLPGDLVPRAPAHGVDTAPLIPYVTAIERSDAPELRMHWADNETILISGRIRAGQIVSVQVTAHPGWHATVAGSARRVYSDKLGFLTVSPDCEGDCMIELHYDGGTEMTVARWINHAALAGALLWVAAPLVLNRRRRFLTRY